MKKLLLLATIIILSACSTDEESTEGATDPEIASDVLSILQSETAWELEYDNEVFEPPYNYEVYNEYQKFNDGNNPNGLREIYYLRFRQGETPVECYFKSIMNESDFEDYYILSNNEERLVIYNPTFGEANKIVYTYENGIMRYQYQEEGFDGDFFPPGTLTPSSVNIDSLNICN